MSATTPTTSGLAEAIGAGRFVLTTGLGTLGGITREELRRRLRVAKEGFAFVKFGDTLAPAPGPLPGPRPPWRWPRASSRSPT